MRRNSKLEKFFMLGVIPFVFTVVLTVALLIFLGVDVGGGVVKVGKNLPIVGKYLTSAADNPEQYEQKVAQLTTELNEQKQMIKELKQQLQAEQEKTSELESQNRERTALEEAEAEVEWMDSYKQVAGSLANMSASKAAAIISQMEPQEGLMMLYAMKDTPQSQVLSKLPPDEAAVYATMIKELLQLSNHMTLAQATTDVLSKYEETFGDSLANRKPADWALVFANMQAQNAAAIVEEMDENKALNILQELDVGTRAAVLANLDAKKASRLSQNLVGSN